MFPVSPVAANFGSTPNRCIHTILTPSVIIGQFFLSHEGTRAFWNSFFKLIGLTRPSGWKQSPGCHARTRNGPCNRPPSRSNTTLSVYRYSGAAGLATRIQPIERRTSMPGRLTPPSPSDCNTSESRASRWAFSIRRRSPLLAAMVWRRIRRRRAGWSVCREFTSRTGAGGGIWVAQYSSSEQAMAASRPRFASTPGSSWRRSGSRVARTRLRRKRGSAFEESSRQATP